MLTFVTNVNNNNYSRAGNRVKHRINKAEIKKAEIYKPQKSISKKTNHTNLINQSWSPTIQSIEIPEHLQTENLTSKKEGKKASSSLPSAGYLLKILILHSLYAQGASGLAKNMLKSRGISPTAKVLNTENPFTTTFQISARDTQKEDAIYLPDVAYKLEDTNDIANEERDIIFPKQKRDIAKKVR